MHTFVWEPFKRSRSGGMLVPFDAGDNARTFVLPILDDDRERLRPWPCLPKEPMRGGGYRKDRKLRPDLRPRAIVAHCIAMVAYRAAVAELNSKARASLTRTLRLEGVPFVFNDGWRCHELLIFATREELTNDRQAIEEQASNLLRDIACGLRPHDNPGYRQRVGVQR